MDTSEAALGAIAFAEDHMRRPVTVAAMAQSSSYSLYHFCRLFGRHTLHSPYDYLIRRRMTLAVEEVVGTDRKIVDIAMEFQFDTHEGFTRAFKRVFGISPTDARKRAWVPAVRRLPRLTGRHLACLPRHNGLRADVVRGPVSPCRRRVPVELVWPSPRTPLGTATPSPSRPAVDPTGHTYARFALADTSDDMELVLDWILHVWLFRAPYTLRTPSVAINDAPSPHVLVPVASLGHSGAMGARPRGEGSAVEQHGRQAW